jgi:sensor c-di-GMP phosphodiesterase-like protein
MAIPWVHLIKYAPTILSLSREVLQRTGTTASLQSGTEGQVRALAADLKRQAEVVHALAEQMQGLTAAVTALRRALILALALGVVACVTAAASLILILVR